MGLIKRYSIVKLTCEKYCLARLTSVGSQTKLNGFPPHETRLVLVPLL